MLLWESYVCANWNAVYYVFENLLDLMIYLIITGTLLGFAVAGVYRYRGIIDSLATEISALEVISGGFMTAICVGLFISGLSYEMGRQLAPLMCVQCLLSMKSSCLIISCQQGR